MEVRSRTQSKPWWTTLFAGVLLLFAGIALLFWPFITASWVLSLIFGVALVSSGIASLMQFNASISARVLGVLLIAVGALAIIFNEFTASILVTIVGATFITISIMWLVFGFALRAAFSPLVLVPAIFGLIAGIVPFVWPEFALSLVAVATGLILLIWGLTAIIVSFRRKNAPHGTGNIIIHR